MRRRREDSPTERADRLRPRRFRRAMAACAISLLMMPGSTFATPPHSEPSIETIHDGGVCPPDTQFGVINVPGAGMSSVGVYAARQTEVLLGDDFDECEAGLRFGSNYNKFANTQELREFVVTNELETVVLFVHSFGLIAATDMVTEYHHEYPDANTKFAIICYSSPGDVNDLQPLNWAAAQAFAKTSSTEGVIESLTYLSTIMQGDNDFLDPQMLKDVEVNAADTPPTLVEDQMKRLIEGVKQLPTDIDIPLYYIGDDRDQVVDIEQAVATIERLTGRRFVAVKRIRLISGRMGYHADLWWPDNHDIYKPTVKEYLRDALGKLGTYATKPVITIKLPRTKIPT